MTFHPTCANIILVWFSGDVLGKTAHSVEYMFSLYLTICNLVISCFGYEGWILVLVHDICILFSVLIFLIMQMRKFS